MNYNPLGKRRLTTSARRVSRFLLSAISIVLTTAICHAADLKVGQQYPLPVPKPGHVCVVVVVGLSMMPWFARNVMRQAVKIADKYGPNIGVEIDVTSDNRKRKLYAPQPPASGVTTVYLNHKAEVALGFQCTPMMYIMDASGTIQKVQSGWTGYSSDTLRTTPWLIQSASACLDTLVPPPQPTNAHRE